MPEFIQSAPERPRQGRVLAGVIFFVMLILGAAGIGAVYYLEEQKVSQLQDEVTALDKKNEDDAAKTDVEKEELELQLETAQEELRAQEEQSNSFKSFGDQVAVTAEVPSAWSVFINPENIGQTSLPDRPTASIAPDKVAFGDSNAGQIDFYYAENNLVEELIAAEETDETERIEEIVGGESVQVLVSPVSESGDANKEASGGKTYFIPLEQRVKTLIIRKQSKGDSDYEDDFDLFLSKIQIQREG